MRMYEEKNNMYSYDDLSIHNQSAYLSLSFSMRP